MFVGAYGEASGAKPHRVKSFLQGIHGHVSGCTTGRFELLRAKYKNLFEPVPAANTLPKNSMVESMFEWKSA